MVRNAVRNVNILNCEAVQFLTHHWFIKNELGKWTDVDRCRVLWRYTEIQSSQLWWLWSESWLSKMVQHHSRNVCTAFLVWGSRMRYTWKRHAVWGCHIHCLMISHPLCQDQQMYFLSVADLIQCLSQTCALHTCKEDVPLHLGEPRQLGFLCCTSGLGILSGLLSFW